MTEPIKTNGEELPASRQAAVQQGLAFYQETAAERDALVSEVRHLKSDIAGFKVALEAKDAQAADLESRVNTMMLVRDEAVARRAELETVLASIMALGRTFQIQNAPLVKEREPQEDISVIGGA